ncbi:hypothetical protein [Coralliovum pocilloporae]|uniref:hypothetical protein n=1 Tax=Coralliovum pocilloporae TaxID=3066369 RepID=UPI0033073851
MKDTFDPLVTAEAISVLADDIREQNLEIRVEYDFDRLNEVCQSFEGKELSEQFQTRYFDFTPANAFWLAISEPGGRIISVVAARFEDLSGIRLSDHWLQQQKRIYIDPYGGDARLAEQSCPGAEQITGRVVYHGDMWLEKEYRGGPLAMLITRLSQLMVYAKWQPDYIYCFMSEKLVQRGFSTGQGYAHMQPVGTHWLVAPHHIPADDWLLWNARSDLTYLARVLSGRAVAAQSYSQAHEPRLVSALAE